MFVVEGVRLGGERFQNPDRFAPFPQRHGGDGSQAEPSANLPVSTAIFAGVVAAHGPSKPQAFAGNPGINVEASSQCRRGLATSA
jgi:hypothetical protein